MRMTVGRKRTREKYGEDFRDNEIVYRYWLFMGFVSG
jgi:hypothetical protein